nr:M23 family metallopeptidase [Arsenicicoccus piscis]
MLCAALGALPACSGASTTESVAPTVAPSTSPSTSPSLSTTTKAAASPSSPSPTSSPTSTAARAPAQPPVDPHDVFATTDRTRYTSPWFTEAWPVLNPFGCTTSPLYGSDPRCPGKQGFHHGTDIAMACGTTILAGIAGTVLAPDTPTRPGRSYGPTVFRIRTSDNAMDVLVAHAASVRVRPGQRVAVGEPIATAGSVGAPDGCQLHVEVRAAGGDVTTAVDPGPVLALSR